VSEMIVLPLLDIMRVDAVGGSSTWRGAYSGRCRKQAVMVQKWQEAHFNYCKPSQVQCVLEIISLVELMLKRKLFVSYF